MEIKKTIQTKRIHHTVIIESIPYLRNEEQVYDFETKEWVRKTMNWSVGDKDGNGPYVIPGSDLDSKGKYTPVILEREFKLVTILQ